MDRLGWYSDSARDEDEMQTNEASFQLYSHKTRVYKITWATANIGTTQIAARSRSNLNNYVKFEIEIRRNL